MKHDIQADLSGKQCVITGASAGIGKELARTLSGLGANVIMACRDMPKAERVAAELRAENPHAKLRVMLLDVSNADSIRRFANKVLALTPDLDILINNAGGWTMERRVTADGFEVQWATNVLGPHLLTRLLAPALAGGGRIVNVASTAAGGLVLEDTQYEKRKYSGVGAYSATKQALRMLTWVWAKRLLPTGVMVNAMSPGLVNTELNRNAHGLFGIVFTLTKLFAKNAADGADTAAWLAAAPAVANETNQFWENRQSVPCKFRLEQEQERLFEICEQQTDARLAGRKAA